jgi:lipid kinase YegS
VKNRIPVPRLIVNGKSAGRSDLRSAITTLRKKGIALEVRSTFEGGDVERFVNEAINEGVSRLLIGGGDGSINEAFDALLKHERNTRPELGILPLGTANDFASACRIPENLEEALLLASQGETIAVDALTANDRTVANIATAGFGAQVTAETPSVLKNFFGGGAYTLTGIVKALGFKPYKGRIISADMEIEGKAIIGAICNGRQAGGGQQLAPKALLTDGLMDVVLVLDFPASELNTVIEEILNTELNGKFVKRFRTHTLEVHSSEGMPCNLDGEPYQTDRILFNVVEKAIDIVLPPDCPCV